MTLAADETTAVDRSAALYRAPPVDLTAFDLKGQPPPADPITRALAAQLGGGVAARGAADHPAPEWRDVDGGIVSMARVALHHLAGLIQPVVDEVLRMRGQPLDAAARAHYGGRLGQESGSVRIHTSTSAG
jgi:hypothetical protein